ncbi:histidyl-tRNA synthetase [Raphidocelis subcapitata]|uniref:Histidine--tRNA ligase, cytoplasmic n=1 Tax=Raphidocelis subcapitata TaxID=307507 RepID=A0A2V0PJL1_9CHLO|nr:histidyl-tRNA synthetase [Raphidocelis subcapitata]|eukprot:GBF98090.1 histidyl-tRNA synthetase [Raphidocelis subcapitata]
MAEQRAVIVGALGAAAPSLEQVAAVAAASLPVALDPAGSERVKKEAPRPFVPEEDAEQGDLGAGSDAQLTPAQARAVVFARLLSLANGKTGVRLQLLQFLAALLNGAGAGALPLPAAAERKVMAALADACKGAGAAGAAVAAAGLEPPALSAAERAVLLSGGAASAGLGALVVQWGRELLGAATAVAALSCEAFGASAKPFDADVVEAGGHKAAAAAADQLRSQLEGSRCVSSRKGVTAQQAALFSNLPQLLGTASDSLSAAYAAVRAEVQSSALAPLKGGAPAPANPLLATTLADAGRALLTLAASSLARATLLAEAAAPAPVAGVQELVRTAGAHALSAARASLGVVSGALLEAAASDDGAVGQQGPLAGMAADAALAAALEAISIEALAALAVLRIQQGPAESGAEQPPEQAADGDGAAAKRKAKKPSGPVLGKGTAIARAVLEAPAAGGTAAALPLAEAGGALAGGFDAAAACAGVRGVLDPRGPALPALLEELRAVVEANQARRKPKVAKGARDFMPDQMAIREAAFAAITGVFKRHGAVSIDTPVFELRETLMGKYGEDSKLIYDLADQGGELLSLRYDLTVPFARYVAVNAVGNIKRYHIGKVYRRDQPQMNRGRFREFFQCDFDIAGAYPVMVPDAEVLKVLTEILDDLALGDYEVKLNHRKLLDAMLAIAGVPAQKFRAICSAIDKLDKEPWGEVRREMTEDKGLAPEVADTIGQLVVLRGEPRQLLSKLQAADHPLARHPDSAAALAELDALFGYLEAMGALHRIVFDLSLARGLDYYTGVIYEAVLQGGNVGSIAAGGRYDKLVGMFSGKDVPAVGVSIGIERVFAILEAHLRARAEQTGTPIRATETEVLVASIGNGMQPRRMELASRLWSAGIKAEFGFKANPKMGDQLGYALEQGVPLMVLFGEDELARGVVKVKDMAAKAEATVALDALVDDLRARISALPRGLAQGGGGAAGNSSGISSSENGVGEGQQQQEERQQQQTAAAEQPREPALAAARSAQ